MDIFCEQIVKKKKTTFEKLTVALIWLGGWLISMMLIFFGMTQLGGRLFPMSLLAAGFVVYGVFKLSGRLNLEYEYSVTNGVLDIDKIINRSSRKRLVSADVATFDRFELFDADRPEYDAKRYDQTVVAVADPMGQDAIYAATFRHPAKGKVLIVFQPGEKVLKNVMGALPRHMQTRR